MRTGRGSVASTAYALDEDAAVIVRQRGAGAVQPVRGRRRSRDVGMDVAISTICEEHLLYLHHGEAIR
jgi:hypothetical protein